MLRKTKKFMSICLVCVLFLSLSTTAFAVKYPDSQTHWAASLIDKWSDAGVLKGTTSGFKPDQALTRGELATALYQVFNWDKIAVDNFKDLVAGPKKGEWTTYDMYTAMLRANAAGVILGAENKMRPYDSVTRQEAAVMLCRAFNISSTTSTVSFSDSSDIASWAVGFVNAIAEKGYMTGSGDNKFHPNDTITRAEILSVFEKMCADYDFLSKRAAGPVVYNYTDYKVATVDTWKSGDYYKTQPDGTKDIMIRLWMPENTTGKVPLLIFVHGGAWVRGSYDTNYNTYLLKTCMENGIAFASIGYRLCTEASSPYGLYDLKGCIRYLRANADKLGVDSTNFGISGSSAGASYASLLALSGDEPEVEGTVGGNIGVSSAVQYSMIIFGVYNFMNCFQQSDTRINNAYDSTTFFNGSDNTVPSIFGLDDVGLSMAYINDLYESGKTSDPNWKYVKQVQYMSPSYWLDKNDPPAFIYHGTEDPLIPLAQGVDLYAGLKSVGVDTQIRLCSYTGHAFTHPVYMQDALDWLVTTAHGK